MYERAAIEEARREFHATLLKTTLTIDAKGHPSNSDSSNRVSIAVASGIAELLKAETVQERIAGQTSGTQFEASCADFLRTTFPQLAAALGSDYTITPDVVVVRGLESDESINCCGPLVNDRTATRASLRERDGGLPLLHASVSCKWTIRSDRAQNARSEALNLVRNRKGRLPHVVVVTAEPLPSRLASIALGTGDIDCVYHFALYELQKTVELLGLDDAADALAVMVDGNRLKDISDLPLDLAV